MLGAHLSASNLLEEHSKNIGALLQRKVDGPR